MFCPSDNSTIMSCGDKDGIYLWSFYGDVRTQFAHQTEEALQAAFEDAQGTNKELKKSKSGSVLEKLRNNKKEAKMHHVLPGQLKEGSFILPPFRNIPITPDQSTISSAGGMDDHGDDTSGM